MVTTKTEFARDLQTIFLTDIVIEASEGSIICSGYDDKEDTLHIGPKEETISARRVKTLRTVLGEPSENETKNDISFTYDKGLKIVIHYKNIGFPKLYDNETIYNEEFRR